MRFAAVFYFREDNLRIKKKKIKYRQDWSEQQHRQMLPFTLPVMRVKRKHMHRDHAGTHT